MRLRLLAGAFLGILTSGLMQPPAAEAAPSCDSLMSLKLPDTTISAATLVTEGPFTPPPPPVAGARAGAPLPVPSFCRVQLTVRPQITIEIWMPATGWNL